jgi:hypothetical protein
MTLLKPIRLSALALAGALTLAALPAAAAPFTFNFEFDNTDTGSVEPPIVGTGFLTFDDPGDGTFDFFSLTNVDLGFTFGADTWGLANLDTSAGTLVEISTTLDARSLVFTGNGNGPYLGSIDFQNPANPIYTVLTFGPSSAVGRYALGNFVLFGDYAASAVAQTPLPATLLLFAVGLAGLRLSRCRGRG